MPRTVLVADDNLTIQRMAAEILSREGMDVVTVANGVAAIRKLPEAKPLVVLADVDMPGKDGYEVCDFVKSSSELHYVRVLLVVSDADPYDQQRGKNVRADGIVKKPFEQRQLVSMVTEYLGQAEALCPPPAEEREVAEPFNSAVGEPPADTPQLSAGTGFFEPTPEASALESAEPLWPTASFSAAEELAPLDEPGVPDSGISLATEAGASSDPPPETSAPPWNVAASDPPEPHSPDPPSLGEPVLRTTGDSKITFTPRESGGSEEVGSTGAAEAQYEHMVESLLSGSGQEQPLPSSEPVDPGIDQEAPPFPSEDAESWEDMEHAEPLRALPPLACPEPRMVALIVGKVVAKMAPALLPADARHELETKITAEVLSELK